MIVTIKGSYTISGKIDSDAEDFPLKINCPSVDGPDITLDIHPKEQLIEATGDYDISHEFLNFLRKKTPIQISSKNIEKEAAIIRIHLLTSTRRVLNAIKYCFKNIELDEEFFRIKGTFWSIDRNDWGRFPGGQVSMAIGTRSVQPLNIESVKILEAYLAKGYDPFLFLSFLHRAKRETNPKYKWIDATIAAELAIKECFINFKPEIEPILLEVPSPPLHKLYGSILEFYTGQRSPRLKEISNGVTIRNKLVHRPEIIKIDHKESMNYVDHVEEAIGHLLSIFYPEYYQKNLFVEHYSV